MQQTRPPTEWVRLDARAREYARKELQVGGTLARACIELLDEAEPWAHLPSDVSENHRHDFRTGRLDPSLRLERNQLLPAAALFSFLEAQDPDGQRILIFEDPYAKPTDPSVLEQTTYTPVAVGGDRVFEIILADRAWDEMILPVSEYPIIGVASRLPYPEQISPGASLSDHVIVELARRSVAVLVAAWDAENYIVFDRGLLAAVRP